MLRSLDDVLKKSSSIDKKTIAVASAADHDILQVAESTIKSNIANFIFIGDSDEISSMIKENNYDLKNVEIIHSTSESDSAKKSIELVRKGVADMPMKGLLPTSTFMKAVLDKENGLRGDNLISQITITENINGDGLNFITDCAMNVAPDLNQKVQILNNAVYIANKLGYDCPKVAMLTAIEKVNPAMQETIDAAILSKMNDRGQIKNCIVDGPFALDNAISEESAKHKGVISSVAGNADILLVPHILMGNVLHKAITFYAKKRIGSVVVGTSSPLVMTSRSDSVEDKVLSIALSSLVL